MKMRCFAVLCAIIFFGAIGNPPASLAVTIPVENPGENTNLHEALTAAAEAAGPNDTILLPAGSFYIDGNVRISKPVRLIGAGSTGTPMTRLYRRESLPDNQLEQIGTGSSMITISCNSHSPTYTVVSGIAFEGKRPSRKSGDGLSQARDKGVSLFGCIDFLVEKNVFRNFGDVGVLAHHYDTVAGGVIANNEFYNNWKINNVEERGRTLGYGVNVSSREDNTWKTSAAFGSKDFVFVEDNFFDDHRHAIAAGGGALYVFRHNLLVHNYAGHVIDAHGGGAWSNTMSARAYEVYDNTVKSNIQDDGTNIDLTRTVSNPCTQLPSVAMRFRGGEGRIHHNRIEGYLYGIRLSVEVPGTYPVPYQIGYQNGDVYMWDNTFVPFQPDLPCGKPLTVQHPTLLQEGRDYHLTAPPSYTAYTYPHPLRSQLGNGEIRINTETAQESALLSPVPASPDQNVSYLLTTIPFMGIKLGQLGEQPFQALAQWLDVIIKTVLPGSGVQPTPEPGA